MCQRVFRSAATFAVIPFRQIFYYRPDCRSIAGLLIEPPEAMQSRAMHQEVKA